MQRVLFLILILSAWLAGVGATTAHAQVDRDQVRIELERTDRALERGQEHLAEAPCDRGAQLLATAHELQRKARGSFLANTRAATAQAVALTRQAQKVVAEAIQACQVDFQAHAMVENLFTETEQAAQEVRNCLSARSSGSEVEHLLNAGLEQLDKAREAYRSERYRETVQRATTARNLIRRALQQCQEEALEGLDLDRVSAALDRTTELLAELAAHPALASAPRARAVYEQARTQQEQARALLQRGELEAALRATEAARNRAVELSRLLEQAPDRERVVRTIETLTDTMSELASEIRASERPDAIALLDKSGEALDLARSELSKENLTAAGRAARIAGALLERAAEKAGLR